MRSLEQGDSLTFCPGEKCYWYTYPRVVDDKVVRRNCYYEPGLERHAWYLASTPNEEKKESGNGEEAIVILHSCQSFETTLPKVIAAIPCFNTEHFIGDVVSRTKKYVGQVIVIDDGSHDSTAEVATAAGALVVSHSTNKGYGEAIKSCFEVAKANAADVLVTLDGDGQHKPDEIPRLLAPILKKEADLVIGSRFLSNENNMPRYRKFGISVITFLWNFGSKVKISDAQSGFRAYGKKIFKNLALSEKGMSISIETLEKTRRKGATIKEVPISCLYIPSTLSLKAVRHGLSVALSVVRIRLKNSLHSLIGGSNAGNQDS